MPDADGKGQMDRGNTICLSSNGGGIKIDPLPKQLKKAWLCQVFDNEKSSLLPTRIIVSQGSL